MKQSTTKIIGAFVLGGIALTILAVLLFTSQNYFIKKRFFVAYFEQSVVGVSLGAPVRFRGIPIGEVIGIDGVYNPITSTVLPRLTLEFHPEVLENAVVNEGEYTLFGPLVESGMRASLQTQSFLTGQLFVSLDFRPDKPVRRLGDGSDRFPEMPTFDTGLARALSKWQELPIEEIVAQLSSTLTSLEVLLQGENLQSALNALPSLFAAATSTVSNFDTLASDDLPNTLADLRALLHTSQSAVDGLSGQISGETLGSVEQTLDAVKQTMASLQETLTVTRQRLSPNDPLNYEMTMALKEIAASAKSIRELTNYIEEHPEALLKGKARQ